MGRTKYTTKTPETLLEQLKAFSDMQLIHRLHRSWFFSSWFTGGINFITHWKQLCDTLTCHASFLLASLQKKHDMLYVSTCMQVKAGRLKSTKQLNFSPSVPKEQTSKHLVDPTARRWTWQLTGLQTQTLHL